MTTLSVILAAAFVLGVVFTPAARALAARYGLVDEPDGRRKMHARPVPLSGGLAVLLAAVLALAFTGLASPWLGTSLLRHRLEMAGLLLASVVICGVGLVDDLRLLRGRHKLLGQMVAVGIVIASGVEVQHIRLFGYEVELGLLAVPFTAFWLLGAINSLNLIDGMDGLLGSLAAILSLAMMALAVVGGHWHAASVAAALAGALLAFLCFNFPPATVFLGDCGSMLVGLVVGVLAITTSMKGPATVALAAPVAMFAIPIWDSLAAIIRRKLTGRSIYTTDRAHIHHCLMRHGLSARGAVLFLSSVCLVTVVAALVSAAINSELPAIIAAGAVIAILASTRLFGHAEFHLIKQRVCGLVLSFVSTPGKGAAHATEVRLQGSADWQELWRSLTGCAEQLNLKTVRLDVNAPAIYEGYHARWDRFGEDDPEALSSWRAEIPLLVHGQLVGRLEVTGFRDDEPAWRKVAKMAKMAEEVENAIARLTAAHSAILSELVLDEPLPDFAPAADVLTIDRAALGERGL
jgi:UDP-GlcNAc:undecaprenyl-phosphate GlcNAc-1-phosphate transferase